MAFIYDLSDTWNNAGISFNGIKLNATDTASAAGSKLLDLQINSASKFTVGKTGTVIATGLIESTVGGFKFPDGTTQTTKATVNSVSGTGTVNGITLTGTITNTGSLTLGGTLGNIANSQLTNSAITINGTSTPLGGSIAVGTVTSVGGTGTVSGLSLTGNITTSGSLTLGGTLVLTSGQVTDGLGYTPYNATNPAGYTTNVGTVTSVAGTGTVNGLTLTGSVTTSGSLTLGGTLGNIANSQLTNSAITINGTSTALGGSISVGTVTSVAALTLGTSGTDLASSVANGTTTPVITLNVPTASAVNRGALSSSDWSTFNAKQAALVSGTNIKTVGGASLLGSGDVGTIGLAYGGTGATTASGARTALGLGTAAVLNAGVASGVATLDGSGTVPTSQLPGAVLGGLNYQGTWNASTNTPTLASSTGSKGYYYVVSVAGSTNLDGITDWKIGDWAVYDGTTWQKVDNTDAVSSVNGYTGAVVLSTSDVAQGTNLYFTQAAARSSVSAGTGISYDSGTGVITNSAPDQTVALTGAGTTVVTGTYPNFTITSNDSAVGTVTSVGGTGTVSGLTLTGTVTTSGNLTLGGTLAVTPSNFASQIANTVLAAPNGAAGAPTFRAIVAADIPTLNQNTTGTASNVTGTIAVANGGTGTATAFTAGSVVFAGASGVYSQDNANLFWDNANDRLGIGINTPTSKLEVAGTTTITNGLLDLSTGYSIRWGGAASGIYSGAGTADMVFTAGSSERMRVNGSTGNLGVGTNSPDWNITAGGTTGANVAAKDSTGAMIMTVASGAGYLTTNTANPMLFRTNNTERMRITSAGDVGIGTSSPVGRLGVDVGAAGAPQIVFGQSSDNPFVTLNRWIGSGDSFYGVRLTNSVGDFAISTAPSGSQNGGQTFTERMRITSAGNVGIGTASPGAKLDVVGQARATTLYATSSTASSFVSRLTNQDFQIYATNGVSTGNSGDIKGTIGLYYADNLANLNGGIQFTRGGAGTDGWMNFLTSGAERMRIDASGNVGIGTASPAAKLDVNGNIYGTSVTATGGLAAFAASGGVTSFYSGAVGTIRAFSNSAGGASVLAFNASGSENMRINSSGNLLVGTSGDYGGRLSLVPATNPTTATGANQISIGEDSANAAYKLNVGYMLVSGSYFAGSLQSIAGSAGAPLLFNADGGNVGIGLVAPTDKLHVYSGASGTATFEGFFSFGAENYNIRLKNDGTNSGYLSQNPAAGGIVIADGMKYYGAGPWTPDGTSASSLQQLGGNFIFTSNTGLTGGVNFTPAERMRITSTGNVGIGCTPLSVTKFQTSIGTDRRFSVFLNGSDSTFGFLTDAGNWTDTLVNGSPLRFGTGGTERMRIDSSGNVGIGTTNPTVKLTVSAGSVMSRFQTGSATDGRIEFAYNTTDIGYLNMASATQLELFGRSGVALAFGAGGSERARIDASGNVGIGTTSTLAKLHVAANATYQQYLTGTDINQQLRLGYDTTNNVGKIQSVQVGVGFKDLVLQPEGGNVGIGTSSPISGYQLTMEGNGAYAALRCVINAGYSTLSGFDGATQRWAIGQAGFGGNNGLGFYVGSGTEVGRFDASGNLLVGTTAIGAIGTANGFRARPDGRSLISSATDGVLEVGYNGGNATGTVVGFYKGGALGGSITTDGSTTAYNTSSDVRLKHDIIDAPEASSLIDAIQVRSFKWNADNTEQRYGFVAQELVTVAPEAVSQPADQEDMMGVDYSKLVPMLVKEIQSLRARVAQLEGN